MFIPYFDVAIVGASLAGCAAARLFANEGFSVALLEKQADPGFFKPICTHYLLSSATPTLERLGLLPDLKTVGAVKSNHQIWTPWGWISHGHLAGTPAHGYSLPRASLDPALRRLAVSQPSVSYFPGHNLQNIETSDTGQISELIFQKKSGGSKAITARLFVGADGRTSKLARLASVPEEKFENNRFLYYRYFRNLPLKTGPDAQIWMLNPDMAYCFPNPHDVTLVAAVISKIGHTSFKENIDENMLRFVSRLPDAPDFSNAIALGSSNGMYDLPLFNRKAGSGNLALIGDAALTTDPISGAGCGWALQSAEWLVDCVSPALKADAALSAALNTYSKLHEKNLLHHQKIIAKYSSAPLFTSGDGALFALLARDAKSQRWFHAIYSRNKPPATPLTLAMKLMFQSLRCNPPIDSSNYNWSGQ